MGGVAWTIPLRIGVQKEIDLGNVLEIKEFEKTVEDVDAASCLAHRDI